jgi:hypothetical protein
LDRNYKK